MKTQQILDNIENLVLVVPEFQREYVWSKEQAKQLMISLFRDYPVGSLLIWQTSNPPEIKNKAIDRGKPGYIWEILLDGQQRLTTLYLLIKGQIPPYYKEDEIINDPRNLYFNIKDGEFSYYSKLKMEGDPLWKKVVDCFKNDFDAFTILQEMDINDKDEIRDIGTAISKNLIKLRDILKTDNPIQYVPTSANIDEAIDVFDRVNSKGTKLTEAELVLTHITGRWPQARSQMKQKIDELEKKGFFFTSDYQKNLDFFTRCMVVSMTQSARYSDNAKLKYEDFSRDDYIGYWNKVSKSMDYLVPILRQDALISNTNDLNSTNLLVPIVAHLLKNGCRFLGFEKNSFLYWMFLAVVWSRYSGQTEQRLDKDVYLVMNSQNPILDLVAQIEDQRGRIEVKSADLQGRGSGHPIYKMLYIITKHKKAVDWSNGGTIYDTMGNYYSIQSHHIFPQALLYENGLDSENYLHKKKVNEIANRAFITRDANYEISDKKPSYYLPEVQEKYPRALEQQFIPMDSSLWKVEKYDDFLEERRKLIADGINTFLRKLRAQVVETDLQRDWKEAILRGENDFVEFKSSMRWDYRENCVNKTLEYVIAKTISGFLNTEGGTLFIGVEDDGDICGIEKDYSTIRNKNRDGFRLRFVEIVNNYLGKGFHEYISEKIETIDGKDICIVNVSQSGTPVFVLHKEKQEFYIRASASTQPMGVKEAHEYISYHWNNS